MKTHIGEVRKLVRKNLRELNVKNNLSLQVKEEKLREGFQMEADAPNSTIVFNPIGIKDTFNDPEFHRQAGISTIGNFITILMAHEIGHILDYKKNSFFFFALEKYSEHLEINAWNIGESYIDPRIKHEYEAFKNFSLDSYRNRLN